MDNTFKSPKALATEIKDVAPYLFLKPYNRFIPDDKTLWWLIPVNEYPTCKYGKLFFEVIEGEMFCGFHIEKGVRTDVSIHHKSLQINDEWLWNEFMKSFVSMDEKIVHIVDELASEKLKSSIVISIELVPTINEDDVKLIEDSFSNQKKDFASSQIEFEISNDSSLSCRESKIKINKSQEDIASFISELKNETNLLSLMSKLRKNNLSSFDWLWVNVYFGSYIKKENISPTELWVNYLKKWEPWLRKHEK